MWNLLQLALLTLVLGLALGALTASVVRAGPPRLVSATGDICVWELLSDGDAGHFPQEVLVCWEANGNVDVPGAAIWARYR